MGDIKSYYNTVSREKYKGDYERNRWFSTALDRARYNMMHSSILYKLCGIRYSSCFELGPGPGTWTKVLVEHMPNAHYTLLDISEEMRKQFADMPSVEYRVGDFETYKPNGQYDFFFSSRAIEYIKDKAHAVKKIHSLLNHGGIGMIITKTPHYTKMKLLGQNVEWQHMGQINPDELAALLSLAGFADIEVKPAVVYIPVLGRINAINNLFWRLVYKVKLDWLSQLFSEAYIITFTKQ